MPEDPTLGLSHHTRGIQAVYYDDETPKESYQELKVDLSTKGRKSQGVIGGKIIV